jgi:hypothetical protein
VSAESPVFRETRVEHSLELLGGFQCFLDRNPDVSVSTYFFFKPGNQLRPRDPTVSGGDTTPSIVIVQAPRPDPVVISRAALVALNAVNAPIVTVVVPLTLFCIVTLDPLVHVVLVPDSVSMIGIAELGATIDGFALKLGGEGEGVGVGVGVCGA